MPHPCPCLVASGAMRRWVWAIAAIALAGCNGQAGKAPPESPPAQESGAAPAEQSDPNAALFEQLSSGAYQSSAAIESLDRATNQATELKEKVPAEELKIGMDDVIALIDSAGATLAEFAEQPESEAAVEKEFNLFDERRLKAIEAGNDALMDLREAVGVIESMAEGLTGMRQVEAEKLRGALLEAMDDVAGAIEGFGGKVMDEQGDVEGQPTEIR